ncbi:uncharacterized mitochondrial protein-like protein [Tanacetum coccineum]|uniref:Uncharacterized mitochondrial protein-like protein n=1 Tax=Tanacetum coccineum TaxID=301880 RepID=A0ABQ5H313_9ASTR
MKEKGVSVAFGGDTSSVKRFDEIKEMSETSVANDTSGLVPQRQKASDYDNPDPAPELQNVSPSADTTVPSQQELDLLFGPLYDEFFNVWLLSCQQVIFSTDISAPQDEHPSRISPYIRKPGTTPTHVNAEENNNNQAEFTNPFCTRYTNMLSLPHAILKSHPSQYKQDGHKLATDPEMCMFALTVSTVEPKNIKEAMADSAWIEAMQEELHQFDRLQVWELVDKPFGKNRVLISKNHLLRFASLGGMSGSWLAYAAHKQSLPSKEAPIWIEKHLASESLVDDTLKIPDFQGFIKHGLWYPKDSGFELTAFSDADHAGCLDTRKSTSGGIQFLGEKLVSLDFKEAGLYCKSSAEATWRYLPVVLK